MKARNYSYKGIITVFTLFCVTGCAEMIGAGFGISGGMSEVSNQQFKYCGPDGKNNWEIDKSKGGFITSPNFDRLCGKTSIKFHAISGQGPYSSTSLDELTIYKISNHFAGKTEVKRNKAISKPYKIIGTLKFSKRWYYEDTILDYLKEKVSSVGGHAILEYNLYQSKAIARKSTTGDKILNAFYMNAEATVIRYGK